MTANFVSKAKRTFISYMTDVKCWSESDAVEAYDENQGNIEEILCREDIEEMIAFAA